MPSPPTISLQKLHCEGIVFSIYLFIIYYYYWSKASIFALSTIHKFIFALLIFYFIYTYMHYQQIILGSYLVEFDKIKLIDKINIIQDPWKPTKRSVSRSGQIFDFWAWCLCRSGWSKIGTCLCHNPDNLGPLTEVCVRVWTSLVASPASVHVNRDGLDAILHGMQAKLWLPTVNDKHQ
jgi:hypothetical protein